MDHYCDEVTLPLSFDADGRILIDSENNRGSSLERSDEDVVWSSVPSLQAESAGIPDLRTVVDNKAVLAAVCVRLPLHWFSGLTVPKTLNLSVVQFLRCGGAAEDCSKLPPWKQRRRSEPLRLLSCLAADQYYFENTALAAISA